MTEPEPEPHLASSATPGCLVCGSAAGKFGRKNEFELYKCGSCGLVFVHPPPPDALAIYTEDYFAGAHQGHGYVDYDRDKAVMVPTFLRYLKEIETAAGHQGAILDVGAATGLFLELARSSGWKTTGVEPADYAARIARAKGLDVHTGILEGNSFASETFDVVTLWDVIEHAPDPRQLLTRIRRILKPGGVLALNTPDADSLWARMLGPRWHLVVPPEHINLFGRRSLSRLLRDLGFEVKMVATIGKKFTAQYIAYTLGQWLAPSKSIGHSLDGTWIGRVGVPINLRDNVFVLARRAG